ncbi:MAG: 50S ribosomal protein L29 [Rickettsiales bacterium]|nr:50S ribosomal protein L29 [Rickettsiales bacterium]
MKITELRAKGAEELKGLVLDLKKEQFNLRMQDATGALENKGRIKEVRKTIARSKTLMTEAANGGKTVKAKAAKPAAKTKKKKG